MEKSKIYEYGKFESLPQKRNYHKEYEKMVAGIEGRKRVLLHSCCAVCSGHVIEFLSKKFDVTVFFYNPNIYPDMEYERRKKEQVRLLEHREFEILDCDYDNGEFLEVVKGYEGCKEGGERCWLCIAQRMARTGEVAKEKGFDYFATTLSVSPHKNSQVINNIGERIGEDLGIGYLYSDFKKNEGYKRSIEIANEFGLYKQNYCGCEFSIRSE